jgi:hypothetical protein
MLDDPLVMYRMEALPLLPPVPDPMLGQMRIVRFLCPVQLAVNVALAAVLARPETSAKTKCDFIDMSMDR